VEVEEKAQRFCQQCGRYGPEPFVFWQRPKPTADAPRRFHTLEAFKGLKRSCERQLEFHNKRRRKGEGYARKGKAAAEEEEEEGGSAEGAAECEPAAALPRLEAPLPPAAEGLPDAAAAM